MLFATTESADDGLPVTVTVERYYLTETGGEPLRCTSCGSYEIRSVEYGTAGPDPLCGPCGPVFPPAVRKRPRWWRRLIRGA